MNIGTGGKTDIYDKYNEFAVLHEVADWTGLTLQVLILTLMGQSMWPIYI